MKAFVNDNTSKNKFENRLNKKYVFKRTSSLGNPCNAIYVSNQKDDLFRLSFKDVNLISLL